MRLSRIRLFAKFIVLQLSSLHNACETYWKGLLIHDFQENETYREACVIGREFQEKGSHLVNLKKKNEAAILVSNEALTALKWFGIEATAAGSGNIFYNDVVRWIYDALYKMNVECDFLWPESENFGQYKMIVVPALYAAPDALLEKLNRYVENGGTLIATFKTAFADENVKVSHEVQPRIIRDCLGIRYHQFTFPKNVMLSGALADAQTAGESKGCAEHTDRGEYKGCSESTDHREYKEMRASQEPEGQHKAKVFMELIIPETAETLLAYDHDNWNGYAAVTRNHFGKGNAYYIGCMTEEGLLEKILQKALGDAGIDRMEERFPVIVRKGRNDFGKNVWFYFNYSGQEQTAAHRHANGTELLSGSPVGEGEEIRIPAWGVKIVESGQ